MRVKIPSWLNSNSPTNSPNNDTFRDVAEYERAVDAAEHDKPDLADDEDETEETTEIKEYSPSEDKPESSNGVQREPIRRAMSFQEANSIIGGISLDEDEKRGRSTTDSEKWKDDENERKVFSFSLPFAGSISMPQTFRSMSLGKINRQDRVSPRRSMFSKPAEGLADMSSTVVNIGSNILKKGSEHLDIRNRSHTEDINISDYDVHQLAKFDTNQEDVAHRDVKNQDNGRLRAILQTIRRPLAHEPSGEFPEIKGNVIIMGGLRGSILRDAKTGRRVWIPLKVGFKMRKIDLKVGPEDDDEIQMSKSIYPDGMLTHIGPVDIGRKLIQKLDAQPDCNVHEFSYDWRLSSHLSSARLLKLLNELYEKDENKQGTIIIAHSMGGLIAHHAMQQNPRLVRGLLYVGSPSSCPNILGPMRFGESIMFEDKVLTTKAEFLMRSCFSFLPLSGECFVDADDPSKHYDLDFFDVNTWIEYELSPCVSKDPKIRATQTNGDTDDVPLDYEKAKEYLGRTLKRTKRFLEELAFMPEKAHEYPPMAVLFGCTIPTLRHAKVQGREGIKTGDYTNLRFGNGDGVIYQRSLMPHCRDPRFEVCAKIPSRKGHVSLLTDIHGIGRALNGILEEEKRRLNGEVGEGSNSDTKTSSRSDLTVNSRSSSAVDSRSSSAVHSRTSSAVHSRSSSAVVGQIKTVNPSRASSTSPSRSSSTAPSQQLSTLESSVSAVNAPVSMVTSPPVTTSDSNPVITADSSSIIAPSSVEASVKTSVKASY